MEFEQLSIATEMGSSYGIHYNSLDNDGKIYSKIDWLTVIFENCSLNDVLRWLKLSSCVSDFCASGFESSRGYDQVFKFSYQGIRLETSAFNFYGHDRDLSLFDIVVPKIRLEMSGTALDYLRSIGVDMNSHRFNVPVLPDGGSYHFTRTDFAFDFVNYQPGFVDKLIDFVNANRLPSLRVPLASSRGAVSCELALGSQKTVYLGSPQSDSMLRVYDKRMQLVDPVTQLYNADNPYNNPDSWFRIEWQTRNKNANNLTLDDSLSFLHILRLIFDRFAFADGTVKRDRQPVEFWLSLFPWHEVESRIVQNANFVEYREPYKRLVDSYYNTSLFRGMAIYTREGPEGFLAYCRSYLEKIYDTSPRAHRQLVACLCKINEWDIPIGYADSNSHGFFNNCGKLDFRW